jgi:UDP-2,4-diacetamido-2,4,6-trideoxy-beta-L-altropyranose hydrolase
MSPLRIVFRTDANHQIGTGHFMRCLTLADEMRRSNADICFVSRALPLHLQQMLTERSIQYVALPKPDGKQDTDELPHSAWLTTSQAKDAELTLATLGASNWDWLMVDHYALDQRFETPLRKVCKHVMVIDDLADRVHDCDVLLDQNFYQNKDQRYLGKVPAHGRLLLGPSFALLRPAFKEMRHQVKARTGKVKTLLVFFGGVDADNLTGQVLDVLISLNLAVQVNVVIGQLHPQKEKIEQICFQHGYACHVQTSQMAKLMAVADLAIGAGGTTVWERCALGLPSVCIATAENQQQQLHDLQSAGLIVGPTSQEDPMKFLSSYLNGMSAESKSLQAQSERVMALVDGRGAERVATVPMAHAMQLRLAEAEDARAIFQWRNHPLVRNHSVDTQEISWDEHRQWFEHHLKKNIGPILIGEFKNKPVGVVRFDISNQEATVSIYLVPESGFKGWGGCLLEQAEHWLRQHHPEVLTLHAHVLPNNEPSKKLFAKLKYTLNANQAIFEFAKDLEACT